MQPDGTSPFSFLRPDPAVREVSPWLPQELRGYPAAIKVVNYAHGKMVLLEIGHACTEEATLAAVDFGPEFADAKESGLLNYGVEAGRAWLSVYPDDVPQLDERLGQIMGRFLECMEAGGLLPDQSCDQCGGWPCDLVVWQNSRARWICAACLKVRRQPFEDERRCERKDYAPLVQRGVASAVIVGVLWSAVVAMSAHVGQTDRGRSILAVLPVLLMGGGMGMVATIVVTTAKRLGRKAAERVSFAAIFVGVLLGETLMGLWRCQQQGHALSLLSWKTEMAASWIHTHPLYALAKVMAIPVAFLAVADTARNHRQRAPISFETENEENLRGPADD